MLADKKYLKGKRQKIAMVLINELEQWKSKYKVKEEEFYRLVDKLSKII